MFAQRKLLLFLGIFLIGGVVCFYGCKEEPGEEIKAPINLTATVTGDSLSLRLSWGASSTEDIDGYFVYFENEPIDTVTNTVCDHKPGSLGEYEVKAYKGDDKSDPSNIVSTKLQETINPVGPVWWMAAPSDTGSSGYGWNSNGTGDVYSMKDSTASTPKANTDFYLDSVAVAKGTDKIISPDNLYNDWNATWFHDCGGNVYDTLSIAPTTGYTNYGEVTATNQTFILIVKDKYYVKMKISDRKTSGHHYIKFHYGFQTIAGFRRLG